MSEKFLILTPRNLYTLLSGKLEGFRCMQVFSAEALRGMKLTRLFIEDNDQVVQCADVVHALIDHAAGKGAVADDGNHLAGFPLYFFGTGYTDGRGQGGTPMPGNECITLAFLGRRKA